MLTAFIAYLSELCLYTLTIGFVITRLGSVPPTAHTAGVLFIAEALSALLHRQKRAVRLLPLLLCVPLFFKPASYAAILYPLPPLILLTLRAWTGSFAASRETVRSLFRFGIWTAMILILVSFGNAAKEAFIALIPTFAVFLLLSVLNMRLLRDESLLSLGGRFRLMNYALVVLCLLAGLFLSSETGLALLKSVGTVLYSYMIVPALLVIIVVVLAVPGLLIFLLSKLFTLIMSLLPAGEEGTPVFEFGPAVQEVLELEEEELRTLPDVLKKALIGLAVMLFLYLCYLGAKALLRKKRAGEEQQGSPNFEKLSYDTVSAPRHLLPRNDREVIRFCYRRYLQLCRRRGLPAEGEILSDALRDRSFFFTGEQTDTLRRLWLKARYSEEECTAEEASEARRALRELKTYERRNRE